MKLLKFDKTQVSGLTGLIVLLLGSDWKLTGKVVERLGSDTYQDVDLTGATLTFHFAGVSGTDVTSVATLPNAKAGEFSVAVAAAVTPTVAPGSPLACYVHILWADTTVLDVQSEQVFEIKPTGFDGAEH